MARNIVLKMLSIFLLLFVVSFSLMGCGGSENGAISSSPTYSSVTTGDEYGQSVSGGIADYNVTVSDGDNIVGARISATAFKTDAYGNTISVPVCSSYTELGGGKYTLNGCSEKPLYISATGGFIDINKNNILDLNESTLNTTLNMKTTVLPDIDFVITPLSTFVAGYASFNDFNLSAIIVKLGFTSRTTAMKSSSATYLLNKNMNVILSTATEVGMNVTSFCSNLAIQMLVTDGTGIDNLRYSFIYFANDPNQQLIYGDAQLESFWNDSRVQKIIAGLDTAQIMLGKKVPAGKLRISGLTTTYLTGQNIVKYANVKIYNGEKLIGQRTSNKYGKYSIEVNESDIPRDSILYLTAKTADLNLTTSVPTNAILDKRVSSNIDSSRIGSLSISYVTTLFNDNNNSVQKGATIKKLLFDSTSYLNKNINNSTFFIPLKIIYENQLIPGGASAPIDTEYLTKLAKNLPASSMPYVLDVEAWRFPYVISAENDIIVNEYVQKYLLILNTLKAARPELKFGYWGIFPVMSMYGSTENLLDIEKERAEHLFQLTRSIVDAADFVAPAMYTYWDNPNLFTKIYTESFSMSYRYNKPIMPYLWAEYGEQTPMIGTYIPDNYWKYEVQFVKQYANGIAMWGGINFLLPTNDQNRIRTWDENISWWQILLTEFK
jgi:hypothetical protein